MAYNSNYTGEQIDAAVDAINNLVVDISGYLTHNASFVCLEPWKHKVICTYDGVTYSCQVSYDGGNTVKFTGMDYDPTDGEEKFYYHVWYFNYNSSTGALTYYDTRYDGTLFCN